jgi:hypothetical protein
MTQALYAHMNNKIIKNKNKNKNKKTPKTIRNIISWSLKNTIMVGKCRMSLEWPWGCEQEIQEDREIYEMNGRESNYLWRIKNNSELNQVAKKMNCI